MLTVILLLEKMTLLQDLFKITHKNEIKIGIFVRCCSCYLYSCNITNAING